VQYIHSGRSAKLLLVRYSYAYLRDIGISSCRREARAPKGVTFTCKMDLSSNPLGLSSLNCNLEYSPIAVTGMEKTLRLGKVIVL